MLTDHMDWFKRKPVNIPKVTMLVDHGYHPEVIMAALKTVYPAIECKVRIERSPKPSKAQKAEQGKSGFVPVKPRWVLERSNAWMERCKSLVKNFERHLAHAKAKIDLCFVRLLLKRLASC